MEQKTIYLNKLANSLVKKGSSMTFAQLMSNLTTNGFKSGSGNTYSSSRGVSRLVAAVYHRLKGQGLNNDAKNIAIAFTNQYGNYSYE